MTRASIFLLLCAPLGCDVHLGGSLPDSETHEPQGPIFVCCKCSSSCSKSIAPPCPVPAPLPPPTTPKPPQQEH
jgi:hypothetical protein